MATPPQNDATPAPESGSAPKATVRTFASDMLAAQSSTGAAPIPAPAPEPKQPVEPAPAPEPAVMPPPIAPPAQAPASTQEEGKRPSAIARLIGSTSLAERRTPAPQPETEQPQPTPAPTPKPAAPVGPSPLETYSGDFSERAKEQDASTISVLAAEQDAGTPIVSAPAIPPAAKQHSGAVIALGAFLLIAGGVGVYFAYGRFMAAQAPVPVATPQVKAPIFVDSHTQVSGTGTALAAAIAQANAKPIPLNTVELLTYPSSTGEDIFSALGLGAPGVLTRNIQPADTIAGIVHTSSGQSPFFILSVDSYSATFSGMLSWEATMPISLQKLFPAATPPSTATTSTPVAQGFTDATVSNHDARIYKDVGGDRITYGYWNPTTLIIARDPEAFTEILNRLATAHAQ